ncbi:hypothetical protein [Yoonia sp. I 8.24]|uniref:hypothetical protein n=1 Tax=Yoonia sp. I 8.24 TaxID=1537229 RepID=UPI001EE0E7A3|nr:hypothetical protein [Yoonia sp. I 8.24]MCG3267362.1 hypothetical protein [Yoonia sp. I 8.24]
MSASVIGALRVNLGLDSAQFERGAKRLDPIMVSDDAAGFCEIEEPRRFTQEELDWRAANAPWNLRRDFKTNISWDRECEREG